jgi:asparagine synthase (glutamine-hydrolysing)
VPRALIDRPKTGFGIPIAQWLRTDLRDWAEHLLDEQKLRSQGFLTPEPIRSMWQEHLACTHDRQAYLWNVLMFQAWLEQR